MLDPMLSNLFSFTSHGSGRMLKEINGLFVQLFWLVPVRGSSYLALPNNLRSMNFLLNIRNREDSKLLPLMLRGRVAFGVWSESVRKCWQLRTTPKTYSLSNPMTHQPVGDFEKLMAFNQLPRFENLNKLQVTVFRYQNKNFIPLRRSKRQELPFILDLLFLSDGQTYLYDLIKDLKNLVSNMKQRVPRSSSKKCRICFHVCYRVENSKDIFRHACKTKQPLLKKQMKRKRPTVSKIRFQKVCIASNVVWAWVAHQTCSKFFQHFWENITREHRKALTLWVWLGCYCTQQPRTYFFFKLESSSNCVQTSLKNYKNLRKKFMSKKLQPYSTPFES